MPYCTKKDENYWKRGLELRQKVARFIKDAKRSYITEKLKTYKNNIKKYWKSVKLVLPYLSWVGIDL